jgi:uncharacterized protein YgbK (DUF1537 family)
MLGSGHYFHYIGNKIALTQLRKKLYKTTKEELMDRIGIIADDLTGAADTGVQFTKRGLTTLVIIDKDYREDILDRMQVLAFNTNTRDVVPEIAYKRVNRVAKILKKKGIKCIYKKIDSTLRGNIGIEIESVMDVFDVETVVLTASLPVHKRITVGGYQLVNQVPLQSSEIARNLNSSIQESHLPTLIQSQTKRKVGHINLSVVMQGIEALRQEILTHQKKGFEIIAVDAANKNDLATIANAVVAMGLTKIIVGSAGLASELPSALGLKTKAESAIRKKEGVVVAICGSKSRNAIRQILKAKEMAGNGVIGINIDRILTGKKSMDEELRKALRETKKLISKEKNIIVKLSDSKAVSGEEMSLKPRIETAATKEKLLEVFGRIACKIVKSSKVAGLVLTGGETAVSVCKKLNSWGIVLGDEVLPGIPVGELLGGEFEGLNIITKAGSFGEEDTLVKAIEYRGSG